MNSITKTSNSEPIEAEVEDERQTKIEKKIVKLETKLKKMEKEIEKWDRKEVNLEDDENSAYLVKTRMVKCYMKFWKILCSLRKQSCTNTGRPIHKKIVVENVTQYPDINEGVFLHLNTHIYKDTYYFPDFQEVLSVVESIKKNKKLKITDFETRVMAQQIFERIVVILKRRRRKDFCVALPAQAIEDPADEDQDLSLKLEENKSKGRKEEDVIREFVEKQGDEDESSQGAEEKSGSSADTSEDEEEDEEEEDDNAVDKDIDIGDSDDSDVQILSLSNEESSKISNIEVSDQKSHTALNNGYQNGEDDDSDSDIEILSE